MKPETKNQPSGRKPATDKLKEAGFYLPAAAAIVLVLIFSAVFFKYLFGERNETAPAAQTCSSNGSGANGNDFCNTNAIKITTDKQKYAPGEQVSLHIENLGSSPAYSEPCKDIKVFEKKEGDGWVLKQEEDIVVTYQESNFEKKEGNTECSVELPKAGAGTYRAVVPMYFGCTNPSHYACEGSKVFRSNEFEVAEEAAANVAVPQQGAD